MKKSFFPAVVTVLLLTVNVFTCYAQQWGLYTLYSTLNSTSAKLVDTAGTTYKTWNMTSQTGYAVYLTPGDTLIQTSRYQVGSVGQGGVTGRIRKILWNGTVAWEYTVSDANTQMHHDLCPMPNGNVLFIVYEKKTQAQALAMGASTAPFNGVWSEKIIEVKKTGPTTGQIVWEWHLWDHLCQSVNSSITSTYVSSISQNPQLMNINYNLSQDWIHMNGIDYNADLDQIIMSSHNLNEIWIIDHSTTTAEAASHSGGNSGRGGDFLYRWGNPATYGQTTGGNNSGFKVIHDAHWVPANHPTYPNYMCVYNNNTPGGNVQIVMWQPPYNGYNYSYTPGQIIGPTSCVKPPIQAFTATNEGNSQQLPNGNNLMSDFDGSIYEVSPTGTTLQTIANARSSHAYRFEKCYIRGPIASASASPSTVCEGTQITVSSSAASVTETNPTYSYSWSSGQTTQNINVTPTAGTTYTVTITNTAIGCSATASVSVTVNPVPAADAGDDVVICAGETAQLNASGGTSYSWGPSTGLSNTNISNPVATPVTTTTYTVTVTNTQGCTDTDQIAVTVNQSPSPPVIIQNVNTLTSTSATAYQWYFNGSIIPGANSQSYEAGQDGQYYVVIFDANGCTSVSETLNFIYTGTKITDVSGSYTIYPNPTTGLIYIVSPDNGQIKGEILIFDIFGKLLQKTQAAQVIDISYLEQGIYYMYVINDNNRINRKISLIK